MFLQTVVSWTAVLKNLSTILAPHVARLSLSDWTSVFLISNLITLFKTAV